MCITAETIEVVRYPLVHMAWEWAKLAALVAIALGLLAYAAYLVWHPGVPHRGSRLAIVVTFLVVFLATGLIYGMATQTKQVEQSVRGCSTSSVIEPDNAILERLGDPGSAVVSLRFQPQAALATQQYSPACGTTQCEGLFSLDESRMTYTGSEPQLAMLATCENSSTLYVLTTDEDGNPHDTILPADCSNHELSWMLR